MRTVEDIRRDVTVLRQFLNLHPEAAMLSVDRNAALVDVLILVNELARLELARIDELEAENTTYKTLNN
jgi:hypothetical protein